MIVNEHYIIRFQEVAFRLLQKPVPEKLIRDWYNGEWENNLGNTLQDFFVDNLMIGWVTGIDTIEAVEKIIQGAVDNANLADDWSTV